MDWLEGGGAFVFVGGLVGTLLDQVALAAGDWGEGEAVG